MITAAIIFGNYVPPKIPEPWEKYPYRDLSWAYYTQSINKKINGLDHRITAVTSLQRHACYDNTRGNPSKENKIYYISALTFYINNLGQIISGERRITEYRVLAVEQGKSIIYTLDQKYGVKTNTTPMIAAADGLHDKVIEQNKAPLVNGQVYDLGTLGSYVQEACKINRILDTNYTYTLVTKDRNEIEKLLNRLAIGGSIIGFIPTTAVATPVAVAQELVNICCFLLGLQPEADITGMDKAYPIKGPYQIANRSYHKSFEPQLGQSGGYYQEQTTGLSNKKIAEITRENILEQIRKFEIYPSDLFIKNKPAKK